MRGRAQECTSNRLGNPEWPEGRHRIYRWQNPRSGQWQGLQQQNPTDRCWQETQRSRLRRRINAGSFADLASPGVERQSSTAQTAVLVLRLRDGILSSADRSNVSEDI